MPHQGQLITDRVRQLVRMRGPVIPSQISKEIGTNILMASAILSELTSSSDVKISSVKVGGSPLYYVAGQEAKLQNYLTGLHPKEKETFEYLRTKGVLQDNALEPAIRVALRQLKDFARPIEANANGDVTLFWKWYLLSNEVAELAIKKLMGVEEPPAPVLQPPLQQSTTTAKLEAPAPSISQQQPLSQSIQLQTQPSTKTEIKNPQQQKTPRRKPTMATPAEFSKFIYDFFTNNNIETVSENLAKKTETEHVVLLPSPVGKLKYYCISKNKKTCTDTDISSALVQGQLKKLPVLLLTKGELTKKAQELLSQEIGSIVVRKI
ncbi:TPA: hypothetical protein HA231_02850 [Candidatus Woesearchaeota archaeon]|nr:hypothetical protein [Candidatus Woesearchaeota archaeon]